jgi:uncharacterized protein YjiS (DUF1127 family)
VAQVIEIVLRPGSIEIRFGARRRFAQTLVDWWRRRVSEWREDRDALRLAELDERTLKDIGLGHCAESPLASRVHAYRQQELRRVAMSQLGLM